MKSSRSGILYIFVAVVGYSMLPVFTDHLLKADMQPLDIALWRYAIALPVFWLLSLARRPDALKLPRLGLLVLLGPLLGLAAVVAFFGLGMIPAGTYSVIFYTYPAMVAIISLLLGERLSAWGWVALAITLVGIALTAPDFSQGLSGENFSGVVLALVNALAVAVYFILSSHLLRGRINGFASAIRASAWTVTGTMIALIATTAVSGFDVPPNGDAWLNLLLLAVISTVMPVFTLNVGIQKLGATQAAIFGTIEPLLTAFFALLFLGQEMQPIQWAGGLCIIGSVILLQTMGVRRTQRAQDVTAGSVSDTGSVSPELGA